MQVCFIGHKNIEISEKLKILLKETVILLIKKGATTFLFGSNSEFDDLSWEIVTQLKNEYPFIKRVYVRAAFQYINTSYTEMLLQSYEETYFPKKIENAGKYSYVERNYEMINLSTYCVFYYNKNYLPTRKKQSKRDIFAPARRNSGTKIAYDYAIKNKKQIINLYENLT
ncbi:MAG: hypothetical protein IKV61_02690 [Clostridia bacterium]|nr:hypothetical protein [Clostridia bacterium]